jgi:hypothetical protein
VIGSKVVTTVEPFDGEYWLAEVRLQHPSCCCEHNADADAPADGFLTLRLMTCRITISSTLKRAARMHRRVRGWKTHAACITQLTFAFLHGKFAPSHCMTPSVRFVCCPCTSCRNCVPLMCILHVTQAPLTGFDAMVRRIHTARAVEEY